MLGYKEVLFPKKTSETTQCLVHQGKSWSWYLAGAAFPYYQSL